MRTARVFYEKYGKMKFVSHLDMNRFMNRMVRVSQVPVWYSEGFNPHPYITFALPLSLGFESSYEAMDIRLDDDAYTNEQLCSSLGRMMPEGIKILSVRDPVMKAGTIEFAEFQIKFSNLTEALAEKLTAYLSRNAIFAEKKTKKGKVNTINLAEYINKFTFENGTLVLVLAAGGSKNLNPTLLLDTFTQESGEALPNYLITRTMLFNENMENFI